MDEHENLVANGYKHKEFKARIDKYGYVHKSKRFAITRVSGVLYDIYLLPSGDLVISHVTFEEAKELVEKFMHLKEECGDCARCYYNEAMSK